MANMLQQTVAHILMDAMPGAVQIFKAQLAKEILMQAIASKSGNVAEDGKIAGWAKDIADSLVVQNTTYSDGVIRCTVSVPSGNNEARARVLMDGNPGIGDPPMTKPGVKTWDSNMQKQTEHVPDGVQPKHMPPKFRRGPMIKKQFMSNTGKKCDRKILQYFIEQAQPIIPSINKVVKELSGSDK